MTASISSIPQRDIRVLQPNKTAHYTIVVVFFAIVVLLACADMTFWWKWMRFLDGNWIIEMNFVLSAAVAAVGVVSATLCLMTLSYVNSISAGFAFTFQLVHTIASFCVGVAIVFFFWSPPNVTFNGKASSVPVNMKSIVVAFVCTILNAMIARQLWNFRRQYLKKERRLATMQLNGARADSMSMNV